MDTLTCYKQPMAKRAAKEEDKKNEVLGVSVSLNTKKVIERLADDNERSLSYISGSLLLRGLAAYERDGFLKEPVLAQPSATQHPAEVPAEPRMAVGKLDKNKRKRG